MTLIINRNEPSSSLRTIPFYIGSGLTSLTFSASHLQVSKNGGTEANSAGTVSELGGGVYKYAAAVAELDTIGSLCIRHNRLGVVAEPIIIQVAGTSGLQVDSIAIGGAPASGVGVVNANIVSWSGQLLTEPRISGTPNINLEYIHGISASGGGVPDVNVISWSGQSVASPDLAGFPKVTLSNGTGAGQLLLTNGYVSATGINDKSGYSITNAAATGIAQAVWNSLRSNHTTVGTFGQGVASALIVGAVTGTLSFPVSVSGLNENLKTNFTLAASQNYNNIGTVSTVTTVTNPVTAGTVSDKSGFALSAAGVDAIWDEARSGHTTAGTFGEGTAKIIGNVDGTVGGISDPSSIVSAILAANIDGESWQTLQEMVLSYLSGKVTISDVGNARTIRYFKANGSTAMFNVAASKTDGSRSSGGTIS